MFVLLLMFIQVSLSQVPTIHYTQHLTLLNHTCQHNLATSGVILGRTLRVTLHAPGIRVEI